MWVSIPAVLCWASARSGQVADQIWTKNVRAPNSPNKNYIYSWGKATDDLV